MMETRTIKMKINDESELYSPLDPDRKTISEDVITYLTRSFQNVHRGKREDYVIRIESDAPVDHEGARQKLLDSFAQERDSVKRALGKLMLKALVLAIFGTVVLSIWFFLSRDDENVNLEILSIIGWVAIWEATSIVIMERRELSLLKRNFELLIKAEIVFRDPAA